MRIFCIVVVMLIVFNNCLAQLPEVNWWYDINDMAFGNTAAADIDNDGKLELVFSTYRNDGKVYALNAEDGSLLWEFDTGGCNDVAPLIYDIDEDNDLEVIVPGSCIPKTVCIDGATGVLEWSTDTRGSDSPPTLGDIDNDGKPEILHGEFGGYVICLNAEDGSRAWEIAVDTNSWIQTAPILLDINNDKRLDFVVANWSFTENHKIFAYNGVNRELIWETDLPDGYMYHGASFADIDLDGKDEICIGSYDGYVYLLNSEDGSLVWSFTIGNAGSYVAAPTSLADINNDNIMDIVFFDSYIVGALNNKGELLWRYDIPGYVNSFRGAAISDINGDDTLDIIFGTQNGLLTVLSGGSGDELMSIDLRSHASRDNFGIDHAPVIADFDGDNILDAFIVGGNAEYPEIQNNYGRAYSISLGPGNRTDWLMFRRDIVRSGSLNNIINSKLPHKNNKSAYLNISPNPVLRTSNIELTISEPQHIDLEVYNTFGEKIGTVYSSFIESGIHNFKKLWQKESSGMFFIVLRTKDEALVKKLILLR